MASLRELKKRLRSVNSTGKLAGAMRTVATAKYGRVNSQREAAAPYSAALSRLGADASAAARAKEDKENEPFAEHAEKKPMYVLVASNRGLCGGYNHELFQFFAERVPKEGEYELAVCGRTAKEYCREKGYRVSREFDIPDVPVFEVSRGIAEYVSRAYDGGEVSKVVFVIQEFRNMLDRAPAMKTFLPEKAEDPQENAEKAGGEELIFIPDAETVLEKLVPAGRAVKVHSIMTSCAAGAAAATLIAMRSAYDSSREQAAALETAINRRRQAEITGSVIETASDMNRQ